MGIVITILVIIAIIAVINYADNRKHSWLSAIILWTIFPIGFPSYVKDEGLIKRWWIRILLMLISPIFLLIYLIVIISIGVLASIGGSSEGVPTSTNYHTAYDLQKATGVEFPDVVPVDSVFHENFSNNYTKVYFVPKEPLKKSFFKRLDKVCKEDSICWRKDEETNKYVYHIYPVDNLDRTNKKVSPYRMVGDQYDWDGTYIEVIVPAKGDTITIESGWAR